MTILYQIETPEDKNPTLNKVTVTIDGKSYSGLATTDAISNLINGVKAVGEELAKGTIYGKK